MLARPFPPLTGLCGSNFPREGEQVARLALLRLDSDVEPLGTAQRGGQRPRRAILSPREGLAAAELAREALGERLANNSALHGLRVAARRRTGRHLCRKVRTEKTVGEDTAAPRNAAETSVRRVVTQRQGKQRRGRCERAVSVRGARALEKELD